MHSHRTQRQSTTGCYHTLTVVIFPITIYLLQLLGKISLLATCASGALVVCKAILEVRHHHTASRCRSHPHSPRSFLVPVPVAHCFLCQQRRQLRPHEIAGQRVGICQHCYDWIAFSRQHT